MPNTPTMMFGYEADLTLTLKEGDYRLVLSNPWKFDHSKGDMLIDLDAVLDAIHNSTALGGFRHDDKIVKSADESGSIVTMRAFPEGKWQPWVCEQGTLWVDREGNVRRIDRMSKSYCMDVIEFLYDNHRSDLGDTRTSTLLNALRDRVLA